MLTTALIAALAALAGCSGKPDGPRKLTIAFSNDLNGEIRACGCAAKDYGGLGRRATFLAAVRDSSRDFLLLDGGDLFGIGVNYGKEKADLTLKAMALMNYDALVPGEKDFGFGTEYLTRRVREVGVPMLACNLFAAGTDSLLFPATREVTLRSGLRVGIIGVVGTGVRFPAQVPAGTLDVRSPAKTLAPLVDSLRTRVDLVVVLAHTDRRDAQQLAEAMPGIDLVVHGHDGKPVRQVKRFGTAYVLQVAERGLYMGVATATIREDRRIGSLTSVVLPMEKTYVDDEAIAKLFQAYDLDIALKEKATLPTGVTNGAALAHDRFVGAETCKPCHDAIFTRWSASKHAHAWDILTAQKRELDRDCTPCHSTGFYKAGGFVSALATPHLTSVQCESCHGNGAAHSRDPKVKTDTVASSTCRACHTVDQTPDFEFESFWARIDHGGLATSGGSR